MMFVWVGLYTLQFSSLQWTGAHVNVLQVTAHPTFRRVNHPDPAERPGRLELLAGSEYSEYRVLRVQSTSGQARPS